MIILKLLEFYTHFNDNFSDMVISESETILHGERDLTEEIFGLKF